MFRIAICDDERETRDYLRVMLESFTDLPALSIDLFCSGEELCEALQSERSYDLYILDIMLKAINGVQVGQFIRETFPGSGPQLLFISIERSYAMELFDLHPLNFLIKPISSEKLHGCLKRAMTHAECKTTNFSYTHKRQLYCADYGNIRYFESDNKTVLIHMVDDTHRVTMRLSEVFQRDLPSNFMQVHQSYILNFEYVRRLKYTNALLDNGEEIPISYMYRKSARTYMMKRLGAQQGIT